MYLELSVNIVLNTCRQDMWGYRPQPTNGMWFHLLVSGHASYGGVDAADGGELQAGDAVFVRPGQQHWIACHRDAVLEPLAVHQPYESMPATAGQSAADTTCLISGVVEFGGDLGMLVSEEFPGVISICQRDRHYGDLLAAVMSLAGGPRAVPGAYSDLFLVRLCEMFALSVVLGEASRQPVPDSVPLPICDERIASVVRMMRDNYAHDWDIAALAGKANLSRSAFIERFRRTVGVPPLKYLTALRMRRAMALLKNDGLSLEQVAEVIGYSSSVSLSKAFKRHYGVSPGKVRVQRVPAMA